MVMRVVITCEMCGTRHRLERQITKPESIHIVCHDCEMPLQAKLEDEVIKAGTFSQMPNGFKGFML